jgi:hypothetical protein
MFANAWWKNAIFGTGTEVRRARRRFRADVQSLENRLPLAIYTVMNNDNSGEFSLRYYVMKAHSGDIIEFSPKQFTGGAASTILLTSPIVPRVSLTIRGEFTNGGKDTPQQVDVTLSGGNANRVLEIKANSTQLAVTLQHLTIAHGKATSSSDPSDPTAQGGGILITGKDAMVRIVDCVIASNLAVGASGEPGAKGVSAFGGGIYDRYGTLVIENSEVDYNKAIGGTGGVGIPASSIANATGCNGGDAYGAGIAVYEGSLTLMSVPVPRDQPKQHPMEVLGNVAMGGLGGFGTTVNNNSPAANGGTGGTAHGGGIYEQSSSANRSTSLTIDRAAISENYAIGGNGQMGALGCAGAPGGGAGGTGGGGGFGGAATGGGIELNNVVDLTATGTTVAQNQAIGGKCGKGGFGGLGGLILPSGTLGRGGDGGVGGNGGNAFGAAIFTTGSAMGTYTDGSIIGNTVTGGKRGPGGMPTMGDPPGATGNDGQNGKAQNGGLSTTGGAPLSKPALVRTRVRDNTP